MKSITILGSTGSIGTQTLEVIRQYSDDFAIYALVAGTNVTLLAEQIREFTPKLVVMKDEEHTEKLWERLKYGSVRDGSPASGSGTDRRASGDHPMPEILIGMEGYLAAVTGLPHNLRNMSFPPDAVRQENLSDAGMACSPYGEKVSCSERHRLPEQVGQ